MGGIGVVVIFQFHNGTIKTITSFARILTMSNFNSIMVRLRQPAQLYPHRQRPFQFHNGTIKTYNELRQDTNDVQFQFHNGTIKTLLS